MLSPDSKIDSAMTKKAAHIAFEVTGKFIGNRIANKIVKPRLLPGEIIILPEQREEILNELRHLL